MYKTNKGNLIACLQMMVSGLKKHFAGQTLLANNTTYKADDLVAELEGFIPKLQAVDAAHAAWRLVLDEWNTTETEELVPLVRALNRTLQGAFGATSPVLVDFGLAPLHRTAPTVAKKSEAVEKRQATRAARHTMGKRQRAAIHGVVAAAPVPSAPAPVASMPAPVASAPAPVASAPLPVASAPAPSAPVLVANEIGGSALKAS